MNRVISKRKCMVFCLVWLALNSTAALGGTGTETPKPTPAGEATRAITTAKNRHALEAYEKRNSKITPWADGTALATPDNAALLYYQAFLFRPEPNEAMRYKIRPGVGPTRQIRTYLGHCLPVIEMVETASRIPGCTWGVWPEGRPSWEPLRREIGLVTDILLVDAGILANDGHYRVALERCLTVRRLAQHLSDDPGLYVYSTGPDIPALNTIRDVLCVMPPDADILMWFRGQFAVVPGPQLSPVDILKPRARILLEHIRTTPASLRFYREQTVQKTKGEQNRENIRSLRDEQFLLLARNGLGRFTDSILRILDSEMTYEQKIAQMHRFFDAPLEEESTDPVIKYITGALTPAITAQIDREYNSQVAHVARANGIRAALEVYLVLSKTGRLPEKLPNYLPKDPFTGRDFVYEITDEGFALRCQDEEFLGRKFLEFKVRK